MRILLYAVLLYIGIQYLDGMNFVKNMEKVTIFKVVSDSDPKKRVLDTLQFGFKIRFPEVLLGQIYHESDRLKSNIYKKCNNATGMKYNDRGYAKGICRGHAYYDDPTDSIRDYAEWQQLYLTHYEQKVLHRSCLTKQDYYRFLEWIGYAEDSKYIKKVDKYVTQIERWNLTTWWESLF